MTALAEMPIVAKAIDFIIGTYAAGTVDERRLGIWMLLWEDDHSARAKA